MPRGGTFLLDLTDVGFLGVDGLRPLIGLGEECAQVGVGCARRLPMSIAASAKWTPREWRQTR
jgi:hypothetical protein